MRVLHTPTPASLLPADYMIIEFFLLKLRKFDVRLCLGLDYRSHSHQDLC